MADSSRPHLIHIDVDRRLGHEWDEWDGKPLPNRRELRVRAQALLPLVRRGPHRRTRRLAGLVSTCSLRGSPASIQPCPRTLGHARRGGGCARGVVAGARALLFRRRRPLLPERLAERGLFLRLMRLTSRMAEQIRRRDWVENAAVKVYNALALMRGRKVGRASCCC